MPASVSSRGASPSGGSAAGASRSKRKRSPPSSRSSSAGSSSSGSGSESEAPRRPRSPAAVRRRSPAPVGAAASTALVPAAAAADGASTARTEEKGAELRSQLAKLTATRAGGAYIPPARLRALMAEAAAADAGSAEFQRMSWDALKKSITGLVNKVAMDNIKFIVPELFAGANLIRGRGLFCRSIMKAQMLSLVFTPTFAALASVVNTKLPMVGELLVTRLVSQFRRSFKRNDKPVCHATAMFLAHLVNQRVVHEVLALEVLVLLLEKPTDDAVEVAVSFMREVGAFLAEESPKASNSIFDRFRAVLYEGDISKRVQYMIEVLSQVRQQKFKDNPRIPEALDLVEEEDQITHRIGLDDELNVQEGLNLFKPDADFQANERKYAEIKAEILGENSDSSSGGSASGSGSGSESDDESEGEAQQKAEVAQLEIKDKTETNMVNLRRTIYLTIMSSAAFEEAVHKLLKLQIPEGQEIELCNMIIECCSQERTYSKFYGHIGVRLCKLDRLWSGCFEQCFRNYYDSIHRYETNRLRNIARFFGAVIAADGISWSCFEIVHMTEDDTTSSSRIFIKILFQEMLEKIGQKILVERFKEPSMQPAFANIFPRANPKDTRFSINYFTSIGLGPLTEEMRAYLKDVPRILAQQAALAKAQRAQESSDDSSELSSSDESSSLSSSSGDSRSPPPRRRRRYSSDSDSRSPAPRRRARSDSRSPPPPPPRRRADSRADSRSPPPRRRYDDSRSRSRSPPPPRRRDDSRSPPPSRRRYDSRSPPPKRRHADSRSRSRSRSPAPRRHDSRSPPPQRRRYDSRSPPPARRAAPREDSRSPVPRLRVESRSPVPRRRDDSPPRRRDVSPPRRGGGGGGYDERGAPPHMRSGGGGGYGNGRDAGGPGGYGGAGGYGAPRGDDRPPRGLPPRDNGYARRA